MKNQPDKKAEPREFWVELNPSFPGPYNSELRKYDAYNRLTPQKEVPQIHVIEYSAYQALQEKLKVAIEALRELEEITFATDMPPYGDQEYQPAKDALAKIEGHE